MWLQLARDFPDVSKFRWIHQLDFGMVNGGRNGAGGDTDALLVVHFVLSSQRRPVCWWSELQKSEWEELGGWKLGGY